MIKYVILIFLTACTTPHSSSQTTSVQATVPFKYYEKELIAVPVTINDSLTTTFILDTGIGINILSKKLCETLSCRTLGHHTGKRMSGQEVTVPMSSVKALSFAGHVETDIPVGIFEMEKIMPGSDIGGFLSLGFFSKTAFTVNYKDQTISIEDADSLMRLKSKGKIVPVRIDNSDSAMGVFLPLILPTGQEISVEVDTGSQSIILDEHFMAPLGFSVNDERVRRRDGQDETEHVFTRYFAKIDGAINFPGPDKIGVTSMDAMFQKIIYDGLVGHRFLSQFIVTYNLPESEMIFSIPATDNAGGIDARN